MFLWPISLPVYQVREASMNLARVKQTADDKGLRSINDEHIQPMVVRVFLWGKTHCKVHWEIWTGHLGTCSRRSYPWGHWCWFLLWTCTEQASTKAMKSFSISGHQKHHLENLRVLWYLGYAVRFEEWPHWITWDLTLWVMKEWSADPESGPRSCKSACLTTVSVTQWDWGYNPRVMADIFYRVGNLGLHGKSVWFMVFSATSICLARDQAFYLLKVFQILLVSLDQEWVLGPLNTTPPLLRACLTASNSLALISYMALVELRHQE